MTDPDKSRSSDFKRRRSSGFEPVDTTMWELPDKDATPPDETGTGTPTRWIVYGIVAVALIVVLLLFWIL